MFILETWIHILRDILLNNVTKKYAELSVGVDGMLIQRCNNDVMLHLQRDCCRKRPLIKLCVQFEYLAHCQYDEWSFSMA